MDSNTLMWLWIIAGVGLSASEFAVPGMIAVFLGISAFFVAAGYKLGLLESVSSGFTAWFVTSLFSIFALRELFRKLFSGDIRYGKVNENVDAYGSVVDIIEKVEAKNSEGRIRFRGTTWQATTAAERIAAGKKAKIVARDGLIWIVEPCGENSLEGVEPVSDT